MFVCLETIHVNTEMLELTPDPFKVKKTRGLKSRGDDDVAYQGFIITCEVDPNDAVGVDDIGLQPYPFSAKVEGTNVIVIDMPLMKYSERGGHDELIRHKLNQKHKAGTMQGKEQI